MSGRLIAIGDIHGCSKALEAVLAAIEPTETDTLVALGDYVDRGPDAKRCIDRLIKLAKTCKLIAIQGNHEEMMLDVVRDGQPPFRWLQYGGVETLDSYGFAGDMSVIPPEHYAFFPWMAEACRIDSVGVADMAVSSVHGKAIKRMVAEIGNHCLSIMQQDVLGLDVPMDHVVPMGVVKRQGDLLRHLQRFLNRQLLLAIELLSQRFALDVGHHVVEE